MSEPYYRDEGRVGHQHVSREPLVNRQAVPVVERHEVTGWRTTRDGTVDARDRALARWGMKPAAVFGRWSEPRPSGTRARLIWDKGEWPGMGDLNFPWGPSDEEVYILGAGWTGAREGTVLRANRITGTVIDHPTPKPVSLMERLIAKCPPGVVADPFAGSGATLLAAANQGRRVIGVELEERYCELIAKRLSNQTATLDFGTGA